MGNYDNLCSIFSIDIYDVIKFQTKNLKVLSPKFSPAFG